MTCIWYVYVRAVLGGLRLEDDQANQLDGEETTDALRAECGGP